MTFQQTTTAKTIFVSRAAADRAVAEQVGRALEGAGYDVVLQEWDFGGANFLERMHAALRDADRIVALLSPAYLASDNCSAEWQNAIATDPLNKQGRLVVLRVADCVPVGLLAGIAYWDLVPFLGDDGRLAECVRSAVEPSAGRRDHVPVAAAQTALPTGTLTFLFAEIDDSLDRWQRYGTAMQVAVCRIHDLMAGAVQANRGRLFRASAESYGAVFSKPQDALAAALEAQRLLSQCDFNAVGGLSVRMALHTGPVEKYSDDYVGPTVNRAVRLCSAGQGGQLLASAATATLLAGLLPGGVSLVDIGRHRILDPATSETVYRVDAPTLSGVFRPLEAVELLPNNLPFQAARLVARGPLVADVRQLLERHRLVTLVGTGGVGKTRLALEVATEALDGPGDGVWFVDLGLVSDPALIPGAVAATIGLPDAGNAPALETLVRYLSSRRCLLVLDNCEQVVAEAARVAAEIVRSCPAISIVATSREALGVGVEKVVRVPPLGLPAANTRMTMQTALGYGAVEWFVERAKLVDSRFALTDENAPLVAEICRRVDGIPFMIELIAARVTVLSVSELARRIQQRFPMTEGAGREALPRRKSLKALIDWSHDLLSDAEKTVFRRLAAFVGGCSLDAAESVCSDAQVDRYEVLDLLSSLVDKSLVVADVREDATRYGFLETTRAYAAEKLTQSGESAAISGRHAAWVASFADAKLAESWTVAETQLVAQLLPDIENIRAALHWALDVEPDASVAARIAGGLTPLWQARLLGEGRRYVERIIRESSGRLAPELQARLLITLAATSVAHAKAEAARSAVALYEETADKANLAESLRYLADGLRQKRELQEAEVVVRRSLALFEELGRKGVSKYTAALDMCAGIVFQQGRIEEGRDLYAQVLARYEKVGDVGRRTRILTKVADLELQAGNPQAALALVEPAIEILAQLGDVVSQTLATCNKAAYLLTAGRVQDAHVAATEAVNLAVFVDNTPFLEFALQHVAVAASLRGNVRLGARLLNHVDGWFAAVGLKREYTEQRLYEAGVRAIRAALSRSEADALLQSAEPLSTEDAVALALSSAAAGGAVNASA